MSIIELAQIVLISNCVGGIILAILSLFFKDKFDSRYIKKTEIPQKECYQVFTTKEMYREKELRIYDSIEAMRKDFKELKEDISVKFNLLFDLIQKNNK